ncbi:cell wall synthesis protein CwsA [Mycobacterium sp. MS1601]|uniref:cell wall synthesis protein CwsA n=1 Tax=Mycobacterium sp. MS1601 TaxID=1936029 RepID=UPI0009792141|nr:cell wall synthesis protein CwsA [Mycobacterium sp. MS1601]AQA03028.1 cell wall synthesis protein CwsA [Mycobacterium sp. MS1601]
MTSRSDARLTPRQRLGRGLAYTAVGPVDIARGAVGLSAQSLCATASGVRQQYRKSQLRQELEAAQSAVARELVAAREVVTSLPEAIQESRKPKRSRRVAFAVGAVAVLGLGAVTFSILRRSHQPEPSQLPPSVQVDPTP